MLELKPIELKDKAWIDALVFAENSPSADFNFGNMYMWDGSFRQLVGEYGGRLIVCPQYSSQPFFVWPVGHGALEPVLEQLALSASLTAMPLVFRGVTADKLPLLETLYPGRLIVKPDREYWDYVYEAEKLAILSGKKLHGQRNHCNRFEKENDWSFRPMTTADIPACREFLDAWMASCGETEKDGIDDEYDAIGRAFDAFDSLDLEGGLLYAGGRLCAFTMGEKISSDTFNVHFEKALRGMNGGYAMVNREFVRQILREHPEIRWINREDDTGRPALRTAKLSYHPAFMVEKYTVEIQHE